MLDQVLPIVNASRWVPKHSGDQLGRVVHLHSPAPDMLGFYLNPNMGRSVRLGGRLSEEDASKVMRQIRTLRGYFFKGRILTERGVWDLRWLPEGFDPPLCTPISAKLWSPGMVLFEKSFFQEEGDFSMMERIERGDSIQGIKHLSSTQRIFAGLYLIDRNARGRRWSIQAVWSQLQEVAERGAEQVEQVLHELETQVSPPRALPPVIRISDPSQDLRDRIEEVLTEFGANLYTMRQANAGQVEIRWGYRGDTYNSLIDSSSLRVIDSGICLSGMDNRFNLNSLPSVIREGYDKDLIVVTRRGGG